MWGGHEMRYRLPFWLKRCSELRILNEQPPEVRFGLCDKAYTKAAKDWRGLLFLALLVLPCLLFLLVLWIPRRFVLPGWADPSIPAAMTFGPLFLWWLWIVPRLFLKNLRKLMVEHGIKICIKCGYDLRGSKDICPECGEGIERVMQKSGALGTIAIGHDEPNHT